MSTDEEKIDRLVEQYTPRQLAAAYLKASRRANDAMAAVESGERLRTMRKFREELKKYAGRMG